MSLNSFKVSSDKNLLFSISIILNIWFGLFLLYNRILLVESRQLLAEVLVLGQSARLLLEKEGDMKDAKKWLCDAENRIAQYTVRRRVEHSELPLVVEQRKKLFVFLRKEESAELHLYVARVEEWWPRMEGYLYTIWPFGREKWMLWGIPHLHEQLHGDYKNSKTERNRGRSEIETAE